MRESIASALQAGLGDEAEKDTPITRIGAFAGSTALGSALWRLKYQNDAGAYKAAVCLLAKYMVRGSRPLRIRVAKYALTEWIHDMCNTCLGAKFVLIEDKKVLCATCEGLGKKRYSDKERVLALGNLKLVPLLDDCARIITEQDIETDVRTKARLER